MPGILISMFMPVGVASTTLTGVSPRSRSREATDCDDAAVIESLTVLPLASRAMKLKVLVAAAMITPSRIGRRGG